MGRKVMQVLSLLFAVSFLTPAVESASLRFNECEQVDYSPCRCAQNEQGTLIFCEGVDPGEVQRVFKRANSNSDLHFVYLSPNKTAETYHLPADVLSGRRTEFIQIECPATKVPVSVDGEAFRATSTKTATFDIQDCDLSKMDFNFLRGFNRLKTFTIEACFNIQQSIRTLPLLPVLEQLSVSMSNGWPGSSFRNLDEVALQTLRLEDNDDLADADVQKILKSLTLNSIRSLRSLQLAGNQLTAVPKEVASFVNLNSINLGNNKIAQLTSGQFQFNGPVNRLHLDHNAISSISPGTFQGDFRTARVFLADNSLTPFDESVFKLMLQQMFEGTGSLYIDTNPFRCDCHLAWLIRENRHLLKTVEGGTCSNGTSFDRLDPEGFEGCALTTPKNELTSSTPETTSLTPPVKETKEKNETTTMTPSISTTSQFTERLAPEMTTQSTAPRNNTTVLESSTNKTSVTDVTTAFTVETSTQKVMEDNISKIAPQSEKTTMSGVESTKAMPSTQKARDATEKIETATEMSSQHVTQTEIDLTTQSQMTNTSTEMTTEVKTEPTLMQKVGLHEMTTEVPISTAGTNLTTKGSPATAEETRVFVTTESTTGSTGKVTEKTEAMHSASENVSIASTSTEQEATTSLPVVITGKVEEVQSTQHHASLSSLAQEKTTAHIPEETTIMTKEVLSTTESILVTLSSLAEEKTTAHIPEETTIMTKEVLSMTETILVTTSAVTRSTVAEYVTSKPLLAENSTRGSFETTLNMTDSSIEAPMATTLPGVSASQTAESRELTVTETTELSSTTASHDSNSLLVKTNETMTANKTENLPEKLFSPPLATASNCNDSNSAPPTPSATVESNNTVISTTEKPAKKPANLTAVASVNVTLTAPSESARHDLPPPIVTASAVAAQAVKSSASTLTTSSFVLCFVAALTWMC